MGTCAPLGDFGVDGRQDPAVTSVSVSQAHLSHDALMSLQPSPNVRALYDSNYDYVSGGVGIMVYDGVNAMDALGPYQVFSTAGLRPMLVSVSRDPNNPNTFKSDITTNSGLRLRADRTMADTPLLDILVVTGGALETVIVAQDPDVLAWIRSVDQNTHWTSSVCTGASSPFKVATCTPGTPCLASNRVTRC